MKVGVLTAALQELTPREVRDPDPDRAIEDWLAFAQRAGRELHPAVGGAASDASPTCPPRRCSIRSPTRSTCASRSTRTRARRVAGGARRRPASASPTSATSTTCCTTTPAIRKKKHDFMLRVFDAAVLLGVDAVCGFVGRNQQHSMDENLDRLRAAVRPAAEGGEGRAGSPTASSSARCRAGRPATTGTTTSPTRPARGSRCTASARSTASATSSASTTTRRTRS